MGDKFGLRVENLINHSVNSEFCSRNCVINQFEALMHYTET